MNLERRLTQLVDAWTDEGKSPAYHRHAQRQLRQQWPTLTNAIEGLIHHLKYDRIPTMLSAKLDTVFESRKPAQIDRLTSEEQIIRDCFLDLIDSGPCGQTKSDWEFYEDFGRGIGSNISEDQANADRMDFADRLIQKIREHKRPEPLGTSGGVLGNPPYVSRYNYHEAGRAHAAASEAWGKACEASNSLINALGAGFKPLATTKDSATAAKRFLDVANEAMSLSAKAFELGKRAPYNAMAFKYSAEAMESQFTAEYLRAANAHRLVSKAYLEAAIRECE